MRDALNHSDAGGTSHEDHRRRSDCSTHSFSGMAGPVLG